MRSVFFKTKFVLFFVSLFCYTSSFSQMGNVDSLKKEILKSTNDTNKVNALTILAWELRSESPSEAMDYATQAEKISRDIHFTTGISTAINYQGIIFKNKGEYAAAIKCYEKALPYTANDTKRRGDIYLNLGFAYFYMGIYKQCEENYFKALKLYEACNNLGGQANTLINLSESYVLQNESQKAIETLQKALVLKRKTDDSSGVGVIYANLIDIHIDKGNLKEADEKYRYLEKLIEHFTIKSWTAFSYKLKSKLNLKKGKYADVISDLNLAEKLYIEMENKNALATIYMMQGQAYIGLKDYANANNYIVKAKQIATDLSAREIIKNTCLELSKIYEFKNDYKAALNEYKSYSNLKDSLTDIENKKHQKNIEALYDSEKKEKEITMLSKTTELKEQEIAKQKTIRYVMTFVLVLIAGLLFFILKGYRDKKRANAIITLQKHEVELQKKEIIDSINYAKRIQEAILPPQEFVNEHLPDNFIFYKPKDIVAGDFYWMHVVNDLIFIAAADSTGHGVPGAMISVVCSNALNRSTKEFNLIQPGEILNKTRELVIETFEKSTSDVKDGMDISLLCIDKKKQQIYWSGANNSLVYIRQNEHAATELVEIKADKQPIGKVDHVKAFTTHHINLLKGDTFYLFTDGLPDQFGGPNGKKFKHKQLKELFMKFSSESMAQQKQLLEETFSHWKGNLEQVDDITVIGIKIT